MNPLYAFGMTLGFVWCSAAQPAAAGFTIAAASDLRYALTEMVDQYKAEHGHAGENIEVIFGSSGKMSTQIMNGAPYDLFFSADIEYPRKLYAEGFAVTEPAVYAIGRIVLWSQKLDASRLSLKSLTDAKIRRIAIAQPAHAPYGMRAKEALEAAGVWEAIEKKLVYGENIAHTAQMAESEAADVAIIALSLALFPALAEREHRLIDDSMHEPLTQGYVVTRRGKNNPAVRAFVAYTQSPAAREIMMRYGFVLPEETSAEATE